MQISEKLADKLTYLDILLSAIEEESKSVEENFLRKLIHSMRKAIKNIIDFNTRD